MKKSKLFSALFVCLFALGFTACDDDDNDNVVNDGNNSSQNSGNTNGGSGSGSVNDTIIDLKIENIYGEWECNASNILYSLPEDTTTTGLTGPTIFIQKYDNYNYKRYNGEYVINEETATLNITEGENSKTFRITKADSIELVLKTTENISYTFKRYSDTINKKYPIIEYIAVDLGLSVKWADRNIGAADTTAYGNYFAWGEKNSRADYSVRASETFGETYYEVIGKVGDEITIDDSNKTDTIGENIFQITTNIYDRETYILTEGRNGTTIDTVYIYDAARENCGDEWRTPTEEEFKELMEKCTWEWTTINEVNGYKVTGTNGNYIFLPAAGFFGNAKEVRHAGEYGYYNTSTTGDNTEECRNVRFWSISIDVDWGKRNYGRTIRPVSTK